MNRRTFLALIPGVLAAAPVLAKADGDVGVPEGECVTACWEVDGSGGMFEVPCPPEEDVCPDYVPPAVVTPAPEVTDTPTVGQEVVVTLPNTGSGSTATNRLPAYVSNQCVLSPAFQIGDFVELSNFRGETEIVWVYESFPEYGLCLMKRAQLGTSMLELDEQGFLTHVLDPFFPGPVPPGIPAIYNAWLSDWSLER